MAPANPLSFIERWDKYGSTVTSDHVRVSSQFILVKEGEHDPSVYLKVSTFNLMNKAHSKENCHVKDPVTGKGAFANTPEEDLDESDEQYEHRKNVQIENIIEDLVYHKVDALFLQEIDFLVTKGTVYKKVKDKFISQLTAHGYGIETTRYAAGQPCKPQAIVYKLDTLALDAKSPARSLMPGTEVGGKRRHNALHEVNFRHKTTDQPISLVSAHLHYDGDYTTALKDYSQEKAKSGAMVIWGGDTNHAPGHKIQGLTGDFNQATNYDCAIQGGYTTTHDKTNRTKAYDGFGFCPPPGYWMRSTELAGRRFHVDASTNTLSLVTFAPTQHHSHQSLVGRAWVRRQTLILDDLGYKQKIINSIRRELYGSSHRDERINLIAEIEKSNTCIKMRQALISNGTKCPATNKILTHAQSLVNNDALLTEELSKNDSDTALSQGFWGIDNGSNSTDGLNSSFDFSPTQGQSAFSFIDIISWVFEWIIDALKSLFPSCFQEQDQSPSP